MTFILLTVLLILGLILVVIYRNEYRLRKIASPDGEIKEYWAGAERRRSVRLEIPLQVKYTALPPHNHGNYSVTRNISQGGVQMLIYEKLNVGDIINLELNLNSSGHAIIGKGQIAWLQDAPADLKGKEKRVFTAGIQFVELRPEDKERLNSFIYSQCYAANRSPGAENA